MPDEDIFQNVSLPEKDSLPFALSIDSDGNIWYTATGTGKFGKIDPQEGKTNSIFKRNSS